MYPNIAIRIPVPRVRVDCLKPNNFKVTLNTIPNINNETASDRSIVRGFFQLLPPRDRPSITGRNGKVQGVKTVITPASIAIKNLIKSNSIISRVIS